MFHLTMLRRGEDIIYRNFPFLCFSKNACAAIRTGCSWRMHLTKGLKIFKKASRKAQNIFSFTPWEIIECLLSWQGVVANYQSKFELTFSAMQLTETTSKFFKLFVCLTRI